ncbi:MAG: M48 family metalloprotease [Deltaproteobacteria bacterium]|nr:M48 family metalloprotease [Deltaproteobacteria bacterium]
MFFKRISWIVVLLAFCTTALAAEKKVLRKAKMRSGPGVYYAIVERINKGAKLSVIEDKARWIKVETSSGKQGWVSSKVFKEQKGASGYGQVLMEEGLSGASTTVVTMAARGLTSAQGFGGSGADPLLMEFLLRTAFRPEGFGDFLEKLAPQSCQVYLQTLEGSTQTQGDPELDELERRLGLALAQKVLSEAVLITDPVIDDYINKVGMAVALHSSRYDLSWRFVVFKAEKADAFAVPGGFVFISSGLLEKLSDEAELAGVLGHEVAHVALGHGSAELRSAIGRMHAASKSSKADFDKIVAESYRMIRAPRSRQSELEADALGQVLATCAGYDSKALERVFERLGKFEPSGPDHPTLQTRITELTKIRKAAKLPGGATLKSRFEKKLAASK